MRSAPSDLRWFGQQWGSADPCTWNVSLDAVRSAATYRRPDRARALSRAEVEQLFTREDISLRERRLWRMPYETRRAVG